MNRILSTTLALFCLVASASPAWASDLQVSCADSSCTVSSNAPLFGSDINWIPERVVTKTIAVTNDADTSRELTFAVKPTSTSPIDDYIVIKLAQADQVLWQGTLAQLFVGQSLELTSLSPHQTLIISMTASMDPATPNQIQRSSSVFDFSFTVEAASTKTSSSKTSSSSNNSTSTDETNPESTVLVAGGPGVVAGLVNAFQPTQPAENLAEESNQVLPAFHAATEADEGKILGSISSCRQQPWWWLVLVLELGALGMIKRLKASRLKRVLQGATLVGASLALLAMTCSYWFVLLTGLPWLVTGYFPRPSRNHFRRATIA